jgi:hypothetical protein
VELPFSTFETVPSETPASLATSFIVGLPRMGMKLQLYETLYETFYNFSAKSTLNRLACRAFSTKSLQFLPR